MAKATKCTIEERGNGFPVVGDYVPGDDGELYRVVELDHSIQTGNGSGSANWVRAEVELADYDDVDEDDIEDCSAIIDLSVEIVELEEKYTVNAGGQETREYDTYDDAIVAAWDWARRIASDQGIDEDTLDYFENSDGEEGVGPEGDPCAYWPHIELAD